MDDEINLKDFILVIKKRFRIIIGFVLVATVVAFFNGIGTPKVYKARVTFLSRSSSIGGLASTLGPLSFMGGGGGKGEETDVEKILKSRALAKSIIENDGSLKEILNQPNTDEAVGALQSALVKGDEAGIEAAWDNPEAAAKLANVYARGLIRYLNQIAINVNLQVLDEALPPTRPDGEGTRKKIMMGALWGLFAGGLVAFGLEFIERNL